MLDGRHYLHAVRLQPSGKGGEVVAVLDGVQKRLQAGFYRGLPRPLIRSNFALRGRAFGAFLGRFHLLQPEVLLKLAHEGILARIVSAVGHYAAGVCHPVGDDVNVLMVAVGVPDDEGLAVLKTHRLQVAVADGSPLVVGQVFTRRGADAGVLDGSP